MRQDSERTAAAYHEAGHAVAVLQVFDTARWLPHRAPALPVRFVEITPGGGGNCQSADVYLMRWPIDAIKPAYRPLMESQVCVEISGGISEAIFLGARAAWRSHCSDGEGSDFNGSREPLKLWRLV